MKSFSHLAFALATVAGAPLLAQDLHFNEIYANHAGTDNQEFIELTGPPATSLNLVFVAVVEGESFSAGTLDRFWNLTGQVVPSSGKLVLGDAGVTPNDFPIGASNMLENGTETFYLLHGDYESYLTTHLGFSVKTPDGDPTTFLPLAGTVLDKVGMVDADYPALDVVFDDAPAIGPDGANFPAGIARASDYPGAWNARLEFDLDALTVPYLPRTPGGPNPPESVWVKFTEFWMNSQSQCFVEFTNIGSVDVNMAGWVLDWSSGPLGITSEELSGLGTVTPGESVILTEAPANFFMADWQPPPTTTVASAFLLGTISPQGPLHLRGPNGFFVDSLDYNFAEANSVWPDGIDIVGANSYSDWSVSHVGDAQGSYQVTAGVPPAGNPGTFLLFEGWNNALGSGLAGGQGVPALKGAGMMVPGTSVTLQLTSAKHNGSAYLIIGFSSLFAPLKGGVLVPAANVVIGALPIDGTGKTTINSLWPAGVPSGQTIYFQDWIPDQAGVQGFAATNGVSCTTP